MYDDGILVYTEQELGEQVHSLVIQVTWMNKDSQRGCRQEIKTKNPLEIAKLLTDFAIAIREEYDRPEPSI